eukprot:gene155-biopygen159
MMVANTTAHPDVYVIALAMPEEDLGHEHRHLIELFNTQVLRLALEGIPVIVPTSPTLGPHRFSRYIPPTFPQSSPYVTTVTFPEPSEDENRYDVDHTSPAPCPSYLPCGGESRLMRRPRYQWERAMSPGDGTYPTVELGRVYPDMVVSEGLFPFLSSILVASPTPSLSLGLLNLVIYSSASDLFDEDGPDIGSWKGTLHCESTTATAAAKTETWSPVMGLGYLNLTQFQRVLSSPTNAPSPPSTPSRGSRTSEHCMKYFRRLESTRSSLTSSKTTVTALSPLLYSDFISRVISESTAQGASAFYSSGGLGGNDVTTVAFTPRTYLYTYVGGAGRRSTGWYSGGAGFASGEGGSADVRTGSANRISRIVVAGGDLTGLSGSYDSSSFSCYGGYGGSQSSGGAGGYFSFAHNYGCSGTHGSGGAGQCGSDVHVRLCFDNRNVFQYRIVACDLLGSQYTTCSQL